MRYEPLSRKRPWIKEGWKRGKVMGLCSLCKQTLYLFEMPDVDPSGIRYTPIAHKNHNALERCLFLEGITRGAR